MNLILFIDSPSQTRSTWNIEILNNEWERDNNNKIAGEIKKWKLMARTDEQRWAASSAHVSLKQKSLKQNTGWVSSSKNGWGRSRIGIVESG